MAYTGFELLFKIFREQFKNVDDASVAVVHWNLITNGFRCCGTGESWASTTDQTGNHTGSESLPSGWNSDSTLYTLRYVETSSNRTYLMKALAIDGNLNVNFLRCSDERAASTTIKSRDFVNSDFSSFESAYSNLGELNDTIKDKLVNKMVASSSATKKNAPSSSTSTSTQQQRQPERSPLMVDPPRNPSAGGVGFLPPRNPFGSIVDPFGVGRADLDPLSGGGGGMFMDPRGLPRPGVNPGGMGGPPGFPPGSIPPGARFDPVGPLGLRPNPDPDHERPPDIDDMFM